MSVKPLSRRELARLNALASASAKKLKTSVTLSGNLLTIVEVLAGPARRSAWIEAAVRRYVRRELRRQRRLNELELLNRHADALNAEGDDSVVFQAPWDRE